MSKEIKFRAWDTQYSRWAYFTLGQLISGDVADIAQGCKDWCRYTGLKDKNGKEIFEGDILDTNRHRDTMELGWSANYQYGFIWSKSRNIVIKQDFIDERYEIIGNIYENPDLLKGGPNE